MKRNWSKILFAFFASEEKRKWHEAKKNKKKVKTSKQKRIKWNSGTICKEMKKNIKTDLSSLYLVLLKEAKKRLFCFSSKWNKAKNVYFALLWSETKNFWKQNKAKIHSINFALVGSEKIWSEKMQKKFQVSVRNGSHFASFRFEAKFFFAKLAHPSPKYHSLPGRNRINYLSKHIPPGLLRNLFQQLDMLTMSRLHLKRLLFDMSTCCALCLKKSVKKKVPCCYGMTTAYEVCLLRTRTTPIKEKLLQWRHFLFWAFINMAASNLNVLLAALLPPPEHLGEVRRAIFCTPFSSF